MKIKQQISIFCLIIIVNQLIVGDFASASNKDEKCEQYIISGDQAYNRNNLTDAIKYYEKAVKTKPESVEAHLKLGEAFIKNNMTNKAEELFRDSLKTCPNATKLRIALAQIYAKSERQTLAIRELETIIENQPENTKVLMQLGRLNLRIAQKARAMVIFEKILDLKPASILIINQIGEIYVDEGEYDKASAILEQCISQHHQSQNQELSVTHLLLGKILQKKGKNNEALIEYKKSLEINPKEKESLNGTGIIYISIGKYQEASRKFCEVLRLDPQNNIAKKYYELLTEIGAVYTEVSEVPTDEIDIEKILRRAPSSDDYPDAAAVFLLDRTTTEITDGSLMRTTTHRIVKVFNDRGIFHFGEFSIPYNTVQENIEVNLARTILPDGTVINAALNAIHDITPPSYTFSNIYSDVKLRVISMPALQHNAIMEIKVSVEDKHTMMRGQWLSGSKLFQKQEPVIRGEFIVKVPQSREITWRAINCSVEPIITKTKDETKYRWSVLNVSPLDIEPGMPPPQQLASQIIFSTTTTWEDVCRWFKKLSKDRQKASQPIKDKVKQLTTSLNTKEEKIKAIYEFVATQIRYVAIELEEGAYQPSTPEDVFTFKYGDCKDKVSLMIAMLDEIGVEAFYALITPDPGPDVNEEIPSPSQFNHVIVAVPTENGWIWLDPTADTCAYGDLPAVDEYRTTLVIGKKWCKLIRIPDSPPTRNYTNYDWTLTVSEEGFATGTFQGNWSGQEAMYLRKTLQLTEEKYYEQIMKDILNISDFSLEILSYSISHITDTSFPLEIIINFSSLQLAKVYGDVMTISIPVQDYELCSRFNNSENKLYDLHLGYNHMTNHNVVITFPEKLKIKAHPINIDRTFSFGTFSQNFEQKEGSTVSYSQGITVNQTIIELEKCTEFFTFLDTISQQSGLQLILTQ